jgi:hypothetical protein
LLDSLTGRTLVGRVSTERLRRLLISFCGGELPLLGISSNTILRPLVVECRRFGGREVSFMLTTMQTHHYGFPRSQQN